MSKRKSLNGLAESIATDTRKKIKAALEYAGEKISGDFTKMASDALDRYYNEYTKPPRQYYRTNQLRDSSYMTVNQRTGFKVDAGIIFDPSMMMHGNLGYKRYERDDNGKIIKELPTKEYVTEYEIFSNFLAGIHGWEGLHDGADQQVIMDKYYKDYHNNNTAYKYFKEYMDR